jgi:hypothetical protein
MQRCTFIVAMLCIVCLVCGMVAAAVRAPAATLVWLVLTMLGSASLVALAVAVWGFVVWRESKLGYTTMAGRLRHLDQRDPRTGSVLRRAGEPYLRDREDER